MALYYLASFSQETGTFTDLRDGKVYKTVQIGTQIWMAENLAFKFPDSCYTYDNNSSSVKEFGYMYHWETAKHICPSGWHIPTAEEWTQLSVFFGGRKLNLAKGNKAPVNKMISPNGFSAKFGGIGFINRHKTNMQYVETDGYHTKATSLDTKDWFALVGEYTTWWAEKSKGEGTLIWLSEGGGLAIWKKSGDRVSYIRCIKD